MSFEFSTTGLTIQTYQEIFDGLAADYRAIYGPDINLAADSPDGQRVGIEAKARLDLQTFALNLYNQFDPDLASGESLNKILKLAGITRGIPARSQVDETITTDRVLTLPKGYTVLDDLDQSWITTEELALVAGANTVTLVAENFGAVAADAGTITNPADIILGVVSVTNALAATPGRDEETDPEVRVRRNRSLVSPATSSTGGLFTALGDLTGVTDLAVYENDQDTTDVTLNIAPHTLWCIVEGGEVADIVEAIAKNKTGGCGLKGTVTGTYTEERFKPDGTPFYIPHDMAFDRPTGVPLFATLTVEGIDGAVVDTAAIEAALEARQFSVGESLSAADLYQTVYSVASNFTATLLEISDDDITYTDGRLDPAADEVYSIPTANITITDIT